MNNIPSALHKKILQLIILPTEKCNFRCTYCYEDFAIGKLKRKHINGIKNLIDARIARDSLDALTLSWFGGEPLLAKDVIYEICEAADAHLQAGRLKFFNGDLTTNAYLLTPTVLRRLVALQQKSYQITLDGFGAGHDETRQYASGKGTFDVIWKNLRDIQQTDVDFKVTLRLHQTSTNEASMRLLVDEVAERFQKDTRFNVFFKTIENLGGPKAAGIDVIDKDRAGSRVADLVKIINSAGLETSAVIDGPESNTGSQSSVGAGTELQKVEAVSTLPSGEPKKFHYEGYICYAAKPNSLMIRADGSIGKCTVLMHDPRNRVGELNEDGTMQLDSALVNKVWMRGFHTNDPMELGCPAQKMPAYEAPIQRLSDLRVKKAPAIAA